VRRGARLPRRPLPVSTRDTGRGLGQERGEWRVTAARAEHFQPFLDPLAYRLEGPEGSVVFTGDTQPCASVVSLARNADMMLCMCWDDQERMEAMGEVGGQCGTLGAARMAEEAGVKRLVLVHIGPHLARHGPMEKGIGDVRKTYGGEVVFADELMSLTL